MKGRKIKVKVSGNFKVKEAKIYLINLKSNSKTLHYDKNFAPPRCANPK